MKERLPKLKLVCPEKSVQNQKFDFTGPDKEGGGGVSEIILPAAS